MTKPKDTGRISIGKLILLIRLAKCCQRGNVMASVDNLLSIHNIRSNFLYTLLEGSNDIAVVSPACEQEFDRLLYDWFDSADWRKYATFDPELVSALTRVISSPAMTSNLAVFGKKMCEVMQLDLVEPVQDSLF